MEGFLHVLQEKQLSASNKSFEGSSVLRRMNAPLDLSGDGLLGAPGSVHLEVQNSLNQQNVLPCLTENPGWQASVQRPVSLLGTCRNVVLIPGIPHVSECTRSSSSENCQNTALHTLLCLPRPN